MARAIFTTGNSTSLFFTVRLADKRTVSVEFEAPMLFGNKGKAVFSTINTELIEKLKNHPLFGSAFFLQSEEAEPAIVVEEDNAEVDYTTLCDPNKPINVIDSVTNVAQAQSWVQMLHGTVFSARKAETIKAEAAKKFNAVFPNWK